MGNSINPHIERAQKTGTCCIAKQGLTEFPGALMTLKGNLRMLDLSENKLPSITNQIGVFTLLKSLILNNNRLEYLPEEIGNLRKLESLQLSHNRLHKLPSSLSAASQLRDIDLANNRFIAFPAQLCGLKQLNSVNLSHNKLPNIPDEVGEVNAVELNFNQNQISRISDALTNCSKLRVLRVEENCLEVSAFSPQILKNSQISVIAYDGNLFEPKSFHHLEGYEEYMERYTATKKKLN